MHFLSAPRRGGTAWQSVAAPALLPARPHHAAALSPDALSSLSMRPEKGTHAHGQTGAVLHCKRDDETIVGGLVGKWDHSRRPPCLLDQLLQESALVLTMYSRLPSSVWGEHLLRKPRDIALPSPRLRTQSIHKKRELRKRGAAVKAGFLIRTRRVCCASPIASISSGVVLVRQHSAD